MTKEAGYYRTVKIRGVRFVSIDDAVDGAAMLAAEYERLHLPNEARAARGFAVSLGGICVDDDLASLRGES